jgi:hypothetical protein
VQVGNTLTWNQYSQSSTPPPVAGSSAFSVMDTRHLVLILGTGSNPVTISAVPVWQRSTAHNIELGAAPHRPTESRPLGQPATGGGREHWRRAKLSRPAPLTGRPMRTRWSRVAQKELEAILSLLHAQAPAPKSINCI